MSEVAVFRSFVEAKNKGFTLISDIGQFANETKATFPLTANAYRLALTAGPSEPGGLGGGFSLPQ